MEAVYQQNPAPGEGSPISRAAIDRQLDQQMRLVRELHRKIGAVHCDRPRRPAPVSS